jgi:hypothetical protein
MLLLRERQTETDTGTGHPSGMIGVAQFSVAVVNRDKVLLHVLIMDMHDTRKL